MSSTLFLEEKMDSKNDNDNTTSALTSPPPPPPANAAKETNNNKEAVAIIRNNNNNDVLTQNSGGTKNIFSSTPLPTDSSRTTTSKQYMTQNSIVDSSISSNKTNTNNNMSGNEHLLQGKNNNGGKESPVITNYQAFEDEHNADNENDHDDVDMESGWECCCCPDLGQCHWKFADHGHVLETSRDGSIHATDEVFNSVSHLSALFISVLGSALLISESSYMGHPWKIVSFSIYGLSLCFLFAASTVHHAITAPPKWERLFQLLDYISIYTLIAGTFTPMCLVFFSHDVIGWTFFGCIWFLSGLSIYVTATYFDKVPKWFTMTIYITLGWFGAFLALWLKDYMLPGGIILLIAGGVLYTVGGVIYTSEQPNPIPGKFGFHELWHLFVIMAAATHWLMMFLYVLPYQGPPE